MKRDEITGDWRKLWSEKRHEMYSPPNIIRMSKSRRKSLAGNVARMERKIMPMWEPSRAKRRPDASFPQQRSYPGCSVTMHVPTETEQQYSDTKQQARYTQVFSTQSANILVQRWAQRITQQQQHYIATDREISTYTHTHTATQATPQDRYRYRFCCGSRYCSEGY
jgi:hypothetical protein